MNIKKITLMQIAKSRSFAAIILMLAAAIGIILLITAFFLGRVSIITPRAPTASTMPAIFKDATSSATEVLDNTLYLGFRNNKEELFISSPELRKNGEGAILDYQALRQISETLPYPVFSIVDYFKDSSDKYVYVSVNLETDPLAQYDQNITNYIMQVDVKSRKTIVINSKKIDEVDPRYENGRGAFYLQKISDDNQYLAYNVANCFACEGVVAKTMVRNLTTQKELVYDPLGNITFNIADKTFKYQKYQVSQEQCSEPTQDCSLGIRKLYQPGGASFISPLPD